MWAANWVGVLAPSSLLLWSSAVQTGEEAGYLCFATGAVIAVGVHSLGRHGKELTGNPQVMTVVEPAIMIINCNSQFYVFVAAVNKHHGS